ncbi:MAG: hypothetical protein NVSMB12_11750 [Acidimicrobiales bacterium]
MAERRFTALGLAGGKTAMVASLLDAGAWRTDASSDPDNLEAEVDLGCAALRLHAHLIEPGPNPGASAVIGGRKYRVWSEIATA